MSCVEGKWGMKDIWCFSSFGVAIVYLLMISLLWILKSLPPTWMIEPKQIKQNLQKLIESHRVNIFLELDILRFKTKLIELNENR